MVDAKGKVFKYITSHPKCRLKDIAEGTKISNQLIHYYLKSLVSEGLIARENINDINVYRGIFADSNLEDLFSGLDEFLDRVHSEAVRVGSESPKESSISLIKAYVEFFFNEKEKEKEE